MAWRESSTHWPGLRIALLPVQLCIHGTSLNKSDPQRPHLTAHRTQRIYHQCPSARNHRTTPEVLCPCLDGLEPSLIRNWASIGRTRSEMSHGCSIRLGSGEAGGQVDTWSSLSCSHTDTYSYMHVFSHVQKHTLLSHFYILRYIHMWHMTWPGARSLRPEARRHWVTRVAVFCPESSTTSFLPGARASSKETICLTAIEAFI